MLHLPENWIQISACKVSAIPTLIIDNFGTQYVDKYFLSG